MLSILALCLIALSSVECGGGSSGRRSLVNIAPASSFAVLSVNWKTVRRDDGLKRIVKDTDAERIFEQLGIASDSVGELVVFSDAGTSPDTSRGIILRGSFKDDDVVSVLKARGWLERQHHEREIFTHPADGTSLLALRKNVLVLGTRAGVEGAAAAEQSRASSFTANSTYKKLAAHIDDEEFPVAMMLAVPQTAQDAAATALEVSSVVMNLAGVGPLGELLNKIGYARGLGCVISRKGNNFPVQMTAIMKDEDAATLVSGALTLLKGLTGIIPEHKLSSSDRKALQSFQSIFIDREREVISIKMTMAMNDLPGGAK
jgi:hypothetical protein